MICVALKHSQLLRLYTLADFACAQLARRYWRQIKAAAKKRLCKAKVEMYFP
jgi:hypothetical protein